jgi:M6 family metalloprotease-like protein
MKLLKFTFLLGLLCMIGSYFSPSSMQERLLSKTAPPSKLEKLKAIAPVYHNHEGHNHGLEALASQAQEVHIGHDSRYCSVQASPYPSIKTQPDGSILTVYVKGNQLANYLETVDGYTVLKDTDDYYKYAIQNAKGNLLPTSVVSREVGTRTPAELSHLNKTAKHLKYSGTTLAGIKSNFQNNNSNQGAPAGLFPSNGTRKALLILIDYPDQPFTYSVAAFDSMANTVGYNTNGQSGSFKDYYFDASNGILTLNSDVVGWYAADSNRAVYGKSSINGARPLIRKAVDAAEASGVDFSQYDGDGDGAVDVVMIIHSGRGAEETGDNDDIWSHRWVLGNDYQVTYDGVIINDYIVQPEALGSTYKIANIGVLCHEFGHALGLPDLYDTNGDNGGSAGLGKWDIMAGGTWNNGGATPGYFSAWCKEQLGWVTPTVLTGSGSIANMPAKTASYRINTPDANEYFLIETRQQTEWDTYIPGEGVAIYHINSNGSNANEDAKQVDLEAADGLKEMDDQVNSGNAGDLYPNATNNNSSFDDNTTPNMQLYDGTLTGSSISNITHAGNLGGFSYSVGGGIVTNCVNQTNYSFYNSSWTTVGQSITMSGCQNGGFFESFEVVYYDPNSGDTTDNITLKIFDGDGYGGNLLYTQTGITTSSDGGGDWNMITLAGGVGSLAYVDGNQYTFQLTNPTKGISLAATGGAPYSGGNQYTTSADLTADLAFKVNVTNSSSLTASSSIGTENGCIGGTVNVPIEITNGNDIGAISYKITFDTSKVTFVQPTNLHANLSSNFNYTNATTANSLGEIVIAWFDGSNPSGQNFGTGKLFDLEFTGKNIGNSAITWVTTSPYGELTNGSGAVVSSSFTSGSVTINNAPTPTLTSSDVDNVICAGESVIFTASATNAATYDFLLNGTSVQSGASDTYTTTTLNNSDIVSVIVTNTDGCDAESATITTTVNALPVATLTNDATNNEICSGDNITFTATGGDVGATYEFFVNGSSVQSSTTATFASTTLNDGDQVSVTITNTTGCSASYSTSSSYVNNAMTFDGVDDHIDAGTTLGNFGTSDFTVEFWTKSLGTSNGASMVSKRLDCNCGNFWNINLNSAGKVELESFEDVSCGNGATLVSTVAINDGTWHHVAVTRTGNFYILYLDGVMNFQGGMGQTNLNNTAPFRIGMNACSPTSWSDYFDGEIDDVRVWSVARSAADINSFKNTELAGTETGLTAYFDLNEVNGSTSAADKTGTYTGALGGSASTFATSTNGMTGTGAAVTNQTITVNPLPTPVLTSSDADNILCNGESVTFTATDGATYEFFVNGISAQTNSATNTFITSSLNDGDIVTVTATSASGCSATSTGITVTIGSIITPFNVTGGGDYCPSGTPLAISLDGSQTGINYILIENGTTNLDTLSGTGAALIFNLGTATTAAGNAYTITSYNVATPTCILDMAGSATVVLNCFDITMSMIYDNGQGQGLKNTAVSLYNAAHQLVKTETTDNSGGVTFTDVASATGYYVLADLSGKQHGGINATDAFLITKDFINTQPLIGLKDRAGDVDGNGVNNANDALQVANRFVLNPYVFIQDWLHDNDTTNTFDITNANVSLTSTVLTFGDVNGSYDVSGLANGTKTNIGIFNEGEILAEAGANITVPFYTMNKLEAGAISLVISYPYDVFDIKNVELGGNIAAQNLQYTVIDGRIRLTWFNLEPIELNADEVLINIIGEVHEDLSAAYSWTPTITLGNESELADGNGDVIATVNLTIPTIVLPNQTVLSFGNAFKQIIYPNPATTNTTLEYNLPSDATITIELFDVTGKKIKSLMNAEQTAGIHELALDVARLQNGIYSIQTTVTVGETTSFHTKRLLINK